MTKQGQHKRTKPAKRWFRYGLIGILAAAMASAIWWMIKTGNPQPSWPETTAIPVEMKITPSTMQPIGTVMYLGQLRYVYKVGSTTYSIWVGGLNGSNERQVRRDLVSELEAKTPLKV